MGQETAEFTLGLRALTELTDGTVYVCKSSQADVPGAGIDRVQVESFDGPHPAGLVKAYIISGSRWTYKNSLVHRISRRLCDRIFLQTGLLDTSGYLLSWSCGFEATTFADDPGCFSHRPHRRGIRFQSQHPTHLRFGTQWAKSHQPI